MLHADQVDLSGVIIADEEWDCDADVAVRDLVAVSVSDHVKKADATDELKMPGIGFVTSKLTETTCLVRSIGKIEGFTGLDARETYYADPAVLGGITKTKPVSNGGTVVQEIGFARNGTTLVIVIDRDYEVL